MTHERPAAPGRPTVSEGLPPNGPPQARSNAIEGLSRAQARALARSAPLTSAEFKARRRVAEEGLVSLRTLLDDSAGAAVEGDPGST